MSEWPNVNFTWQIQMLARRQRIEAAYKDHVFMLTRCTTKGNVTTYWLKSKRGKRLEIRVKVL